MAKDYYCVKCGHKHKSGYKIHKKHRRYAGTPTELGYRKPYYCYKCQHKHKDPWSDIYVKHKHYSKKPTRKEMPFGGIILKKEDYERYYRENP